MKLSYLKITTGKKSKLTPVAVPAWNLLWAGNGYASEGQAFNSNQVHPAGFFSSSLSCLIEHLFYYRELLVPDLRSGSVIFLPLEQRWLQSAQL